MKLASPNANPDRKYPLAIGTASEGNVAGHWEGLSC